MQRGFDVFFTHVEDGGQAYGIVAHRSHHGAIEKVRLRVILHLHFIFDAVLGERFLDAKFSSGFVVE